MNHPSKSIVLIGFKSVGKSVIGRALASRLMWPFIDLDHEIETVFASEHHKVYSCRDMMKTQGEAFFRSLEKRVLAQKIQSPLSIFSLGGGAPMDEENQRLIKKHTVVHVIAPRDVVFKRIIHQGLPAFFVGKEPAIDFFNRLWDEREKIYNQLTEISIYNNSSVHSSVEQLINVLGL